MRKEKPWTFWREGREPGDRRTISLPAGGKGASLEGHLWEKLAYPHRAEREAQKNLRMLGRKKVGQETEDTR